MRNIMRNGLRRGFCFLLSMLFFLSLFTGVPVRQQQNLTGFIMAITAFADSDEEGQGSTDLSSEENGSSDSNTGSQAGDEAGTLEEENSGGEGTLPEETPGSEEGTLPEETPGSEADTPAKGATTDEEGYPLNEIAALSAVGLSSPLLAAASGENDSGDGDEKEENSEEENKEGSEGGDSAEGRITAGKEGIIIDGSADAHFDVLISGTLKAGETPILIGENVTPDNISITVWKIETLNPESTAEDRENAIEGEGNFSEGQKNTTAGDENIPDDQKKRCRSAGKCHRGRGKHRGNPEKRYGRTGRRHKRSECRNGTACCV